MVAPLGRVAGARPLHRLAGLHRPEPRLPIPPAASEREAGLPGFPPTRLAGHRFQGHVAR